MIPKELERRLRVVLFGLRKASFVCFLASVFILFSVSQVCWAQAPESFSLISIDEDGVVNCSNLPDLSVIPIKRQGEIYTLTGNIKSYGPGIEIWRSGITLDGAGFTLQGTTGGQGIRLAPNVGKVTVKNLKITSFDTGISVNANSGNFFVGNDVSGNFVNGYSLSSASCNNTISGCKVSNNPRWGISIVGLGQSLSTGNLIFGNTIENNGWERWTIPSYGMDDDYGAGVWLWGAANNTFYGNNFVGNAQQVYLFDREVNVWSMGASQGGNFWSDYTGADVNGDGIGDAQYSIDEANVDPYPLVAQSLPSSSPSPSQVTEVEPSQFPLEYVIILAVILAAIVVVLAVVFKKRKHPHQVYAIRETTFFPFSFSRW
jgi:parallel beta-helix repeat protein